MNEKKDIFADMVTDLIRRAVEKHNKGRLSDAAGIYKKILEIEPNQPEATHLLGVVCHQTGNHEQALELISKAVNLKPDNSEFIGNLATVLADLKEYAKAEQFYMKALELAPEDATMYSNLGSVFNAQGRANAAEKCLRIAISIAPNYAEAWNNLGNSLKDLGNRKEAEKAYRKAIDLSPAFYIAHGNLGALLKNMGRFTEAIKILHHVTINAPNDHICWNNYGNVLSDIGRFEDAVSAYKKAISINPKYFEAYSNMLCCCQYIPSVTPESLEEIHKEWNDKYASKYTKESNTCNNNDKLILGFVSADFGRHPVGYFLVKFLESIDKNRCSVFMYSLRTSEDELTKRLKKTADKWVNAVGASDEVLTECIKNDKVDILFDLSGHTGKNRLLVFARKPVAIQVTWAGYVGTTGLAAMDYLIADKYQVKEGTDNFYSEKIIRMPDGYVTYDAPEYMPDVLELPALSNGYITFGCFNNPCKVNDEVINIWSKILIKLPESKLLFKFNGFDDNGLNSNIIKKFAKNGVDSSRIIFEGKAPHAEFLAAYNRIDIALDTFPYSGGLTTCEAMFMGVPTITCAGETFAGRHSFAHLSNVGLTETIACDFDEYVEKAIELAGNFEHLSCLRKNLREQVKASPLCDGKRFADNLLDVLLHAS
ncbi:MAG: tetratricopeptide repeat protein [Alphaproteobacteria bacterium]|nr:tetratricopeptide repeat protein [Alphaproteobacteria bacterium]